VLSIPDAYPNAAPTLRFVTPVFHPLVSAQGDPRCLLCFTAAHTAHTVHVLTSCTHTHVVRKLVTGEVDLTRAFPRWVAYRDQIWCVLAHVKKLFYHIQADNPLNADAAAKYTTRHTHTRHTNTTLWRSRR
jgi:ubiquitin-protein ligase